MPSGSSVWSRNSRRASRLGRGNLGAGLVEVEPVPGRDPAGAILADPEVPESKRFCGRCEQPVGRSTNGRPGLTQGFCRNCGNRFSFVPKLAHGDLVGPGPGTLLTEASASSSGGSAARAVAAAARDARPWYAVNEQVFRLGTTAHYASETQLVIGTGPTSSAAGSERLEADLSRGMTADQLIFRSSATAGADMFSGLETGVIGAALIILAGSAWGLSRRLAEYQ
jgi:hypothetical protein